MEQNRSAQLLASFVKDISQKNKTVEVVQQYLKDTPSSPDLKKISEIPFSSERKYSACVYSSLSLVMGAPEILLDPTSPLFEKIKDYTQKSYRVVIFGLVKKALKESGKPFPSEIEVLALIAMDDPIREDIKDTLEEFAKDGISFKIISGDASETVISIIKKINSSYEVKAITGAELEKLSGKALEEVILENNIFSRIKPHQKQLIIKVLRSKKIFTTMIGDGVNDVLAIREADLGIAINGGSDMVKDVADIVLLDNSFSTLPKIFNEGKQIIINIHNIANIYLIKNISSIFTILILGFIGLRFPFDPRHVELVGILVIGVPSFALAFDKHKADIVTEGFMKRLLLFAGIVGFTDALAQSLVYIFFNLTSNVLNYERSMLLTTTIWLGVYNLLLIYLEIYPLKEVIKKPIIFSFLLGIPILFIAVMLTDPLKSFFSIVNLSPPDIIMSFLVASATSVIAYFTLKRFKLIKSISKQLPMEEVIINQINV